MASFLTLAERMLVHTFAAVCGSVRGSGSGVGGMLLVGIMMIMMRLMRQTLPVRRASASNTSQQAAGCTQAPLLQLEISQLLLHLLLRGL